MVRIDGQIARSPYFQVKQPMNRKKREHVIEKGDPCFQFRPARPIQHDFGKDPRFFGISLDRTFSLNGHIHPASP